MAKKKTKKKPVKKPAKKRPKAPITGTKKVSKEWMAAPPVPPKLEKLNVNTITTYTELQLIQHLHIKILEIMRSTTFLDCHNVASDGDGGVYHYTEAWEVQEYYSRKLVDKRLTMVPILTKSTMVPFGPDRIATNIDSIFRLTDIETGYSMDVAGSGVGMNGEWSANTAQTLAFKQALLNVFMCAQRQPKTEAQKKRREISVAVDAFNPRKYLNDSGNAIEDIKGFYTLSLQNQELVKLAAKSKKAKKKTKKATSKKKAKKKTKKK